MQLIRKVDLNKSQRPSVATIGTFDGVHLGHQYVLEKLRKKSLELNLPATVICFEPQPQEYFLKEQSPERLTPFRDRVQAFEDYNVDQVVCLQFNKTLRSLSAEDFVLEILVGALQIKYLVVGDDFRFGSDRKGNFELLQRLGEKHSFTVEKMPTYEIKNARVSSTVIRKLIQSHDFKTAADYLGRPYAISGRIHYGAQNGRKIGFPTINLPLPVKVAVSGVYIVKVMLPDNKIKYGVANVGVRPTICGKRRLLEVHLYDFEGDLYGQYVKVAFLKHVRDEQKFDSFSELANQIQKDKIYGATWVEEYKLVKT
jgi:riboflavin kinase/FMN adenylyltransferase